MKKLALSLGIFLVASTSLLAGPKGRTFSGEIMDSQCAGMGGHDPGGYKMTNTSTAKDCTLACVKMGGKFVLYDSANKMTYQLDDQNKPQEFAGQKVKVTGSYDRAAKTIHVQKIEGAS